MHILLIEDDDAIRAVIAQGLTEDRFVTVDDAADGLTGLERARRDTYDVIILDVMLPGLDGWGVLTELRARRVRTPILMLTARDAVADRVRGLELGADDYLPKPFDFAELTARVRALYRRDKPNKGRLLHIAHLELDTAAHRVTVHGREVELTPREYTLLETLALHEGHVLSREAIQYQAWHNRECGSNTVDVHVGILRKKIDAEGPVKLIHTMHGVGYVLESRTEVAA